MICPISMECQTAFYNGQSLFLTTRDHDVSRVTLIKGSTLHEKVHVLTGECRTCHTKYFSDHETSGHNAQGQSIRFYLNNAKYIKVGQNVWVDHIFSGGVMNGMYHFHASAGMRPFGLPRRLNQERFLTDRFGMVLCRNLPGQLHNPQK